MAPGLVAGPQVLDVLVGVQHVRAYLVAPCIVGFGGVERNFDAIILHLDLGRATDADEFNQLRETDGPP